LQVREWGEANSDDWREDWHSDYSVALIYNGGYTIDRDGICTMQCILERQCMHLR
jgi:hypothetical protein